LFQADFVGSTKGFVHGTVLGRDGFASSCESRGTDIILVRAKFHSYEPMSSGDGISLVCGQLVEPHGFVSKPPVHAMNLIGTCATNRMTGSKD
jgi:hypothetical protein